MKQIKAPVPVNFSKILIAALFLTIILAVIGLWWLKNPRVAAFLIEHPIIILPYFIGKVGFLKVALGLIITIGLIPLILFIPDAHSNQKNQIIRGSSISDPKKVTKIMKAQCRKEDSRYKHIQIGNIPLPQKLENRGFFFFGDPGTGKSQSIKQVVSVFKTRPDMRGIIFDRNGEMLREFYDPKKDLIYNPFDSRSVHWSHINEIKVGVRPETIAEALIPPPLKTDPNPFFPIAAAAVLSELYRVLKNNKDLYQALIKKDEDLRNIVGGSLAERYLAEPKLASSVVSSANNFCKFYRDIQERKDENISFYEWGYNDNPRWLFISLTENDAPILKPLHSMLFELMLKGLLSNQNRQLKTVIVIDELGALNRLDSLGRLLSESRKFRGCPILGTQTPAQVTKIYGKEETSILLQGTSTKLMLRCSDPVTSEEMAKIIGKSEEVRFKTNYSQTAPNMKSLGSKTRSTVQEFKEAYRVLPSEIQNLPDLSGYLKTIDVNYDSNLGGLTTSVKVPIVSFKGKQPSFIPLINETKAQTNIDLTKS